MKRNLLLLTSLFFTFFTTGQSPTEKSGIVLKEKIRSFDNYQDLSGKGERLDSFLFESWDKTIPGWVNTTKVLSVYGTNSQTDITYSWDKNTIPNKWARTSKTEKTYVNGNNTLTMDYLWNGSTWNQFGKTETSFNLNGKPTLTVMSVWFVIQWQNTGKTEYYYDLAGNDTLEIDYTWETFTNNWVNSEKTRFANNINGKVLAETILKWDKTLTVPAWVNSGKSEYTYDSNWNLTSEISYEWDNTVKQWVNSGKMDFIYTGNEWTSTITYIYDKDINPATGWVYFFKMEKSNSGTLPDNVKYTEMKSYLWETNQWSITNRDTYYYSGQATSVNDNPLQKEVNIHPNPAKDYIIFSLTDIIKPSFVEIYDIMGRKVIEHKLLDNDRISVSNLKKGIYIYKLSSNGFVHKGKIIIR